MSTLSHLQIRNSKDDETPIESATQIFASLLSYPYIPLWKRLFINVKSHCFELYLLNQTVYFYVSTKKNNEALISSLINSSYPGSVIK